MTDLIDEDQSGFKTGRQAQDNVRCILHMIDQIPRQGLRAVLVSFHAEKKRRKERTMYSRSLPRIYSEDKN